MATSPQVETATGQQHPYAYRRSVLLLGLMMATSLEVWTSGVVNIILPDMMGNISASIDEVSWVATAYTTAFVIFLPLTTWLARYFGQRHYLSASVFVYGCASLGCSLSATLPELLFWRAIQGAAGAAFLARSQVAIYNLYPMVERGPALMLFGVGVFGAKIIGPIVGGALTDVSSWHWFFMLDVPMSFASAILIWRNGRDSPNPGSVQKPDVLGVSLMALGLGSLQLLLSRGQRDDWFSSLRITALASVSVIALFAFFYWQLNKRNSYPALNLRLFRNRRFSIGLCVTFFYGVALAGGLFILPQFLRNVRSHDAEQTGAFFAIDSIGSVLMIPVAVKLLPRVPRRWLVGTAMATFAISMWWFSILLTSGTPDEALIGPLLLRGASVGLMIPPVSASAIGTLPLEDVAAGAGFYNLVRQLGASIGVALITLFIDLRMSLHSGRLIDFLTSLNERLSLQVFTLSSGLTAHGQSPDIARRAAYVAVRNTLTKEAATLAYADIFLLLAGIGIVGAMLALFIPQPRRNS